MVPDRAYRPNIRELFQFMTETLMHPKKKDKYINLMVCKYRSGHHELDGPRLVYIDSTLSSANKVKGHTTNSNALQRNCLMRTGQTRYVTTRLCCVIF